MDPKNRNNLPKKNLPKNRNTATRNLPNEEIEALLELIKLQKDGKIVINPRPYKCLDGQILAVHLLNTGVGLLSLHGPHYGFPD